MQYVLGSYATEVRYFALFMRLAMAAALCGSLLTVLRSFLAYTDRAPRMRMSAEELLVVGALAHLTPFIPIKLSDCQSLALFLFGYGILAVRKFDLGIGASASAGLLAGFSVLLKQNSVVAATTLFVLRCSGL